MVVFYFKSWTIGIALVFLLFYVWYVSNLVKHTKEHKKTIEKRIKISMKKEVITFVLTLVAIGVATYLLTSSAIDISVFLNINPIVIGFTVVAMATSLPDTIISYVNAKKGDFDDAISNIFGSNIFNIFIGLSIPVILAVIFGLKANIDFANIEIIFALLGISILVIYLLLQNYSINKSQAYLFLLIYLLFNAYVIYLSFV
jgi:cation:H+ antiporter